MLRQKPSVSRRPWWRLKPRKRPKKSLKPLNQRRQRVVNVAPL